MGLIIRSSDIHAAGCYTTRDLKKGERVVEYTGRRITKQQGDDLYEGRDITYLFGVGDGEVVIDGYGTAMFINHSCDPNCETDEIDGRVWVIASRNIKAGEELSYDYNLYDGDDNDPAPCACGAKKCRGSMYSEEELIERRKKSRAAAKSQASRSSNGGSPPTTKKRGSGSRAGATLMTR